MVNHCHKFSEIRQDSVLEKFLQQIDETGYNEQKQLPYPTVIESIENVPANTSGKTVVFTAYLQEKFSSKERQESQICDDKENEVTKNWYPTIFFYDLDKNQVVWEIFGSDLFIKITKQNTVFVFTNEFWQKINEKDYNLKKELDD